MINRAQQTDWHERPPSERRHRGRPDRRRGVRAAVAGAAGALVCAVALSGSAGAVGATTGGSAGACDQAWSLSHVPISSVGGGSLFSAVRAVSSGDVWAVGAAAQMGTLQTLAEHWDGSAWQIVATPNAPSGESSLDGVDALSSSDVWAAGWGGQNTLVEHWDGSSWQLVASPNVVGGQAEQLDDLTAIDPSDLWAVGTYRSGTTMRALSEHWDGTSWQLVTPLNPGVNADGLVGVAATAADDVWAVGYRRAQGAYRPLVEHWDGSSWKLVAAPAPSADDTMLMNVAAVSRTSAWAVGYQVVDGVARALVERWNGVSWKVVPDTDDKRLGFLRAVVPVTPNDVWAAGVGYDETLGRLQPLIEHWDGVSWSVVSTPTLPSGAELLGFDATPGTGQLWAVGAPRNPPSASGMDSALAETACAPTHGTPSTAPAGDGGARRAEAGPLPPDPQRRPAASARAPSTTPRAGAAPISVVDRARQAGLAQLMPSWSAVVQDFNGEGWDDLFLGRHQELPTLYYNDHGVFRPVVSNIVRTDRHGCASADVDGDGLPDLFCSVGADQGTGTKESQLEIQQPDRTFADRTIDSGLADPLGRGRHVAFLDANGDGRLDLFIGNEQFRGDGLPSPDRLFLNIDGTHFRNAPSYGLELGFDVGCAQAADFDGDGHADLLLCATGGGATGITLYRNETGHFTDVTASAGLSGLASDARLVDLNGDGHLDLVQVSGSRLTVYLQSGGVFQVVSTMPLTAGRGIAVGDANADGFPDIYVVQTNPIGEPNAPDELWLNDGDGSSFTEIPIPEVTTGSGDFAEPIDFDRNGYTDFLVLNGRGKTAGPLQLLASYPTVALPPLPLRHR